MMEAKSFVPEIDKQYLEKAESIIRLRKLEVQYKQDSSKIMQCFRYSNESVFIASTDGHILNVNRHFLDSFSYIDKYDIIGRNIMNLFSKGDTDKVLNDLVTLFEEGATTYSKNSFISSKGDMFSAQVRLLLLTDKLDRTIGVLGVIKETEKSVPGNSRELQQMLQESYSQIKLYSKKLEVAKESAEQYNKLKSTFLENISHEIRTPLNGIVGFAELLTRESIQPKKKIEYSKIIRDSSSKLLGIINDLLDLSKIQSGCATVKNSEFSINELFKEVYEVWSEEIKVKQLSFRINSLIKNDEQLIVTDRQKITRVFYHLISNAIRFTGTGYIEIGVKASEEQFGFYVKDSGVGISKAALNDIFEQFRKGGDAKSRFEIGMGIGLSLSKSLLEVLGGNITINSSINQGTTVEFSLPRKYKQKRQEDSDNSLGFRYANLDWTARTILIVEDEQYNYIYLKEILKKTNAYIIHAPTAKLALEICKSMKYIDIVLLDIRLPDMSGYNVAAYLKEHKPEAKVIVQSAYTQEFDKRKAMKFGCSDYLAKPIIPEVLIEKLCEHIETL